MEQTILDQLQFIEEENNVHILYAVESGSRGWGFPSKDSDYDVRFLYVHPTEWYLNVFDGPDIIEIPVDEVLDVNGWDLRKALQLLYKSNPPLLEWMSSPIVYRQDQAFVEEMKKVSEQYFASVPVIYHYISLARKSFEGFREAENVRLKKLFYVIRPVFSCMWIEAYHTIPPMNLQQMMDKLEINELLRTKINELVQIKADCTESDTIPSPEALIQFLEEKISYFAEQVKEIKYSKCKDVDRLNQFFQKLLQEQRSGQ